MGEPTTGTVAAPGNMPTDGSRVVDEARGSQTRWRFDAPRLSWIVLGLTLLPFVVSAISLLVVGGEGSYFPTADHAMTDARVHDVTNHPPLIGLYSRDDWAHPGPAMFYLLAPFYWLTRGASIGTHLGALAINAAAVAGMVLSARRRGGVPLMIVTAIGCGLLMRTLGAEFLQDPWNNFLPVLPFGLLMFLTWSMTCGERWALPVAVLVTSFLAQTHVGFLALGVPLLVWGAAWLLLPVVRSSEGSARRGSLAGPIVVSSAVAAVVWLPPLLDVVANSPSNASRVWTWFREAEQGTHTLAQGVRVITGQFGFVPEWLTTKQAFGFFGQSPFLRSAPFPWLLLPVGVAAASLWRQGTLSDNAEARNERRHLVAILGISLLVGAVAVMRTVGPAFDYRLRWTWVPPMVAFVVTAWAGWLVVVRRPGCHRAASWLVAGSIVGLLLLTGINVATAAGAGTPYDADSEVVEVLTPQVVAALPDGEGAVLVREPFQAAAWYARGLVRQLEREGFDVLVEPELGLHFGEHRVYDGEPLGAELVVTQDDGIEAMANDPSMRRVAEWRSERAAEWVASQQALSQLIEQLEAGEISSEAFWSEFHEVTPDVATKAGAVGVFLHQRQGNE